MRIYPFTYALYDDVEQVMNSLTSYDREKWAAAFSSVAKPYEVKASQAEKTGDAQSAKENYLRAYQYYRLARYPTINSDGKKEAYRKSQEMLFKASRYFDFPIERVEMPFKAKSGEGNSIIGYLRLPKLGTVPFPLLISWGGIDGFKEEQLNDPALERGLATLAIDGPGVVTHQSKVQRMRRDCSELCSIGLGRKGPWTLIEWESGVTALVVMGGLGGSRL